MSIKSYYQAKIKLPITHVDMICEVRIRNLELPIVYVVRMPIVYVLIRKNMINE